MPHSFGYRARTRYMFARNFREHGVIPLSTYMKTYKVGDIVDVKSNGAIQKGLPHKFYHGKTGVVYNVTKSAVGVIIHKRVGNRYMEKRINVRVEHVKHSKCRDDFLRRVKENAALAKAARESDKRVNLKRLPAQPREARYVSTKNNEPTTITAIPYDSKFTLSSLI
ncbi:60S ribosomal protein L21A [Coemansia sp. RSA 1939]|nr:60S ribosomal protein L21A [Coemansia sp. RSA 1939]